MSSFVTIIISIVSSAFTSGAVWTLIFKIMDRRDTKKQMLLGLGHDRIIALGMQYIERGYITKDEYENLVDYLYTPYAAMGGNGTGKKIIEDVKKLPIR